MSAQILGIPQWLGEETWNRVHVWMTAPERWTPGPTYAVLVGMLTALGLATLRGTLSWWPFLPAGYAISGGPGASMDILWMSVFIAWLVKLFLLKYGGARNYRASAPFFVGLVLGEFIVGGFWNLYGTLMGVKVYHFWPY